MQISNFFDTALREFQHETRSYNRQQEPNEWTTPPVARFKAVIYLKNNKALWYYSYDLTKNNGKSYIDEQKGISKLCRLINRKQGEFRTAIIYANIDARPVPGTNYNYEIVKFSGNNTYKTRDDLNFLLQGENCILDLHNINLKSKNL
jgi:hypothetical protein